jgi:hypothetical protein
MKLRRWVKDVMLGLAVFAIGTAAILTAGVIANSIEAKQSAVMVSKDVNSNLDCNQTLSLSTDATGSDTSGNGIVTLNDITTGKKIACWGDSITYGLGGQENTFIKSDNGVIDASDWSYPDTLKYYTGLDVYNLGVCGETSYDIALRQGGIKMYVGKQVTVKQGVRAQINIVDEYGSQVMLENFNGYETDNDEPANVVYINDTPFQLEADNGKLYISVYGDSSNKSIKIKKGTQVVTKAAHDISGDVLVIQMGSNGGWDDYDELIQQYKAMIDNSGIECYIIIGDTDNPDESVDSAYYTDSSEVGIDDTLWEAALREAFGEHFINMRVYMIENALSTAGLEPTQEDIDNIDDGRVPESLKHDFTHLNSYGYYAVGVAVYNKGIELGYWS